MNNEPLLKKLLTKLEPAWCALGMDFQNGDCHNLACALIETLGTGRLLAGCSFKDSAPKTPTEYYHMVYQDEDGYTWDADGKHAIENWEETYGFDSFIWIPVELDTLDSWLTAHNATLNMDTVNLLKKDLIQLKRDRNLGIEDLAMPTYL